MKLYGKIGADTDKSSKRHKNPGKLAFIPTDEQRYLVAKMAGMRMSVAEMAHCITNPETGQPIEQELLAKVCAIEIEYGRSRLKGEIAKQYVKKVEAGEQWALQAGLRQYFKWKDNASDVEASVALPLEQLVETLARQAQTLGLHIDLSYKFHDPKLIEGTINKPEEKK